MAVRPVRPASLFDLAVPRRLARSAAMFALGFSLSQSETEALGSKLAEVQERGTLMCGVDDGRPGFASFDDEAGWTGFEIDLCRAYAAAILGSPDRVDFVPLSTSERFDALAMNQIDVLLSTTSWTYSRSTRLAATFAGVYYYDGQGFLVPSDLGISTARELDGARICVQPATTTLENLQSFARSFDLDLQIVEVDNFDAGLSAYQAGDCDAFTNDVAALAAARQLMENVDSHTVLADIISKEPLSPVVDQADLEFAQIIEWIGYALIAAEEFGVTADNFDEFTTENANREVRTLLGLDAQAAGPWGLDRAFARRAIAASGNYGELFDRHLGEGSNVGLRRGLNAQWSQGGLLYAPPFG